MVVSGRVQGVFFRDSTRREAARRGVAGWVCNRPDGKVEAVFEGAGGGGGAGGVLLVSGPRGADVGEVTMTDQPPEGLEGFEIR